MGDVDGGNARGLLDAADFRAHTHPELCVQIGQGFVKQQHARLQYQRPRQGDTLLLTAGKLVRHTRFHAGQLHQLQNAGDPLLDLVLGDFAQLQAVGTLSNTL
mgnify:CR=1 FL=1